MIDSFTVEPQAERSSGLLTATLTDETGAPVTLASMTALTLTLWDKNSRTILNSRQAQNVLNANNVTMHATSGLVSWAIQPADNAIVSTGLAPGASEPHVALFVARWSGGTKERPWLVTIPVVGLDYTP